MGRANLFKLAASCFCLLALTYSPVLQAEPNPPLRRHALVVIDMQDYFVTRGGHHESRANRAVLRRLYAVQLDAIARARASNMPIVLVEYTFSGPTNSAITNALNGYPNTITVRKDRDGAFESGMARTDFLHFLEEKGINHLIITGANGGACVKSTIMGALEHGYNVTAYTPGIADFNYENFIHPYRYPEGFASPHPGVSFATTRDFGIATESGPLTALERLRCRLENVINLLSRNPR